MNDQILVHLTDNDITLTALGEDGKIITGPLKISYSAIGCFGGSVGSSVEKFIQLHRNEMRDG